MQSVSRCKYDPLSEDVDPELKMLVAVLLNKENTKRPTVAQVANIPIVKAEIMKFIEEENLNDEVLDIIDLINSHAEQDEDDLDKHESNSAAETKINQNKSAKKRLDKRQSFEQVDDFQVDNLEEYAYIMHSDIKLSDFKNGWFGRHTRCCRGEDILQWLQKKVS